MTWSRIRDIDSLSACHVVVVLSDSSYLHYGDGLHAHTCDQNMYSSKTVHHTVYVPHVMPKVADSWDKCLAIFQKICWMPAILRKARTNPMIIPKKWYCLTIHLLEIGWIWWHFQNMQRCGKSAMYVHAFCSQFALYEHNILVKQSIHRTTWRPQVGLVSSRSIFVTTISWWCVWSKRHIWFHLLISWVDQKYHISAKGWTRSSI